MEEASRTQVYRAEAKACALGPAHLGLPLSFALFLPVNWVKFTALSEPRLPHLNIALHPLYRTQDRETKQVET